MKNYCTIYQFMKKFGDSALSCLRATLSPDRNAASFPLFSPPLHLVYPLALVHQTFSVTGTFCATTYGNSVTVLLNCKIRGVGGKDVTSVLLVLNLPGLVALSFALI